MSSKSRIDEDFVHLARVALTERGQDVQALLHRIAKRKDTPRQLASALIDLLRKSPTRSTPLRLNGEAAVPADIDSRFPLLRIEQSPYLPSEPVYSGLVQEALARLVAERKNPEKLFEAGLEPTRTTLFTGPPGVGKTMAARWLARELERPLLILDLSAVMSSYLGRTGTNLRHVLEFARTVDCVLLLDELDAIAKRRDDSGEIGELKRLVTVLLQQLDDWPSSGLLVAATNHAELLDPAVWRRFEQPIEFHLPSGEAINTYLTGLFDQFAPEKGKWIAVLSQAMAGQSFSDIEREVTLARRGAALNGQDLDPYLLSLIKLDRLSKQEKIDVAVALVKNELATQRRAHEVTGVARDTIRARLNEIDSH